MGKCDNRRPLPRRPLNKNLSTKCPPETPRRPVLPPMSLHFAYTLEDMVEKYLQAEYIELDAKEGTFSQEVFEKLTKSRSNLLVYESAVYRYSRTDDNTLTYLGFYISDEGVSYKGDGIIVDVNTRQWRLISLKSEDGEALAELTAAFIQFKADCSKNFEDLDTKIDAETSRATARENELESQIKQSGKVDDVLVDNVSVLGEDKIARVDLTPYAKESDLSSEISRAKEADKTLQANIDANEESIASETTRATAKETELENAIKEAGKVDDVKVNDVSVVTDKVANIDLTSYAKTDALSSYVKKAGDMMTGTLNVPEINSNTATTKIAINTGTNASSYFQARKFRGEGNASTYYHAVDFGYANHDKVDFYEYGGVWNFWKNTSPTATSDASNLALGIRLNSLINKSYTYTWPNKTGTFALTSDFADYAKIAYVDEKTALPKISIRKSQFKSSTSIKLTDEQNAILIDTNNDAVLVEWEDIANYPKIVLHRQISSQWLLLMTSIWNAEMLIVENGVTRLKRYLVCTSINDGVSPTYPTADIFDLDTIDFPTISLSKSQVTSISEDGNSMTLDLTDDQYNILCDSLYRAVKVDASGIGLWNDGVIYKLNDDSTDPVYTFFSVSSSVAGIGRIFVNSDKTAEMYITYAVSQEEASQLKEEITTQLTTLQTALSAEAKTREESDTTLQNNLNQEIADRKTSDSNLNITIANSLAEAKAYTDSEAKLREQGDADTLSSAKSYIDTMIEQSLSALVVDGGEVTA